MLRIIPIEGGAPLTQSVYYCEGKTRVAVLMSLLSQNGRCEELFHGEFHHRLTSCGWLNTMPVQQSEYQELAGKERSVDDGSNC